jgi:hypothetical protein
VNQNDGLLRVAITCCIGLRSSYVIASQARNYGLSRLAMLMRRVAITCCNGLRSSDVGLLRSLAMLMRRVAITYCIGLRSSDVGLPAGRQASPREARGSQ